MLYVHSKGCFLSFVFIDLGTMIFTSFLYYVLEAPMLPNRRWWRLVWFDRVVRILFKTLIARCFFKAANASTLAMMITFQFYFALQCKYWPFLIGSYSLSSLLTPRVLSSLTHSPPLRVPAHMNQQQSTFYFSTLVHAIQSRNFQIGCFLMPTMAKTLESLHICNIDLI